LREIEIGKILGQYFILGKILENFLKLQFGLGVPELLYPKKSRKFAGRIWRVLRECEIGEILSQHFILDEKAKACSKRTPYWKIFRNCTLA
jgi:hypothetical protein